MEIKRENRLKSSMLKLSGGKQVLALFMLLISIVGIFNAFRFGAANLDYYSVRNSIELWSKNGQMQSLEQYNSAKASIDTANMLHSSSPLYIELTGQIIEWGSISGLDAEVNLLEAKAAYIEASKLRPLWPVTWANLAMLKWRMQEFDEGMLQYLQKASQLGPNTIEVNVLYSQLGLSLYQVNHPFFINISQEVKTRVTQGIKNHSSRNQIRDFITANNHLITACRWIKLEEPLVAKNYLPCPLK